MKLSRVLGLVGVTSLAAACGSVNGSSQQNPDGSTAGKVAIGGTVSGLTGTGLVLQDNGGDDLPVFGNGPFTFAGKLDTGGAYAVTVRQQPRAPAQTCTVSSGSATSATHDVTDVAVTCVTNQYAVGGTVSGLIGAGLVLEDNGGDDLPVAANGPFAFAGKVPSGQTFTVTVKAQPTSPAQSCAVMGGSGTMGSGDVTSVAVNCSTQRYTIGGAVSGLIGTGLVLENNAGDDLAVSADGTFAFATPIASGGAFAVTVRTQPSGPAQICSVSGGRGTVATASVATVVVHCSTESRTVGGTVTGLSGAGLVLQNNGGDNLPLGADGSFTFPAPVASGATYAVTVLSQPHTPSQTCTVASGNGTVVSANVTDVAVTCTTNTYKVGGTVTGLTGTGLLLRNNGSDTLSVAADGAFTFAAAVASGAPYGVTIAAQPSGPWQTCTVGGGTGTVGAADVVSVTVNCAANRYAIGGTVTGLAGTGLALSLNGGSFLAISGNGSFSFPTTISSGGSYAVAVTGQPVSPWQTCVVTGGNGAVEGADVATIQVDCTTNKYTVGGTITGVAGTGLVLRDNGANDLPIAADGSFSFPSMIASGGSYAVTVAAQPTGPWQTCVVSAGAGIVGGTNVTNVAVTCTTNTYPVSGTVSGLAGTLVLQDNGSDPLTLTANGIFTFNTKVPSGASYLVTVSSQPMLPSQTCTITNPGGSITSAGVTNVTVTCATNKVHVGGTVTGLAGGGLVLRDNGGDALAVSGNGPFAFATAIDSGLPYAVTVDTQPSGPTQTCVVSGGGGTVGGADVTSVTVNCTTNTYTVGGMVSGLGSATGLVLQNNGGDDLAISASGGFAFATPVASGAGYAGTVKSQPTSPWETCTVTNGSGTVTSANITGVTVTCVPNRYNVKVAVSGLAGSGLVLQDNGADNLFASTSGTLTFATTVASGGTYNVTVLVQPSSPWQTCGVALPTGTITSGNVTLTVTCTTNQYLVGGMVSGLTGTGLVLQNNGGGDLPISGNGAFNFTSPVSSGSGYAVTILTQPSGQTCFVSNGSGTITGSSVSNVSVTCGTSGCGRFASGASGGWTLGATVPAAATPAFSDITPIGAGTIYSSNGNSLYAYSIAGNSWTTVSASAPVTFSSWTGPAWVGNNLYFIHNGGVYRYAISTAAWSTLVTGLPPTQYNDNAHDTAGNIYSIDNAARVIKFNPSTNAWNEIIPAPPISSTSEPHIAFDSCSGLLYLVPSYAGKSLYSMDPNSGATVLLATIPSGQISDGFCGDNSGHLYAAGTAGGAQFLQFNIATNTWVTLPPPPQTVGNCGSCSVGDDGFLYFASGCSGTDQLMRIQLH